MNNHPFLINEDFIAYLPSLGKALGSIEDAVIAQWLWFKRDRETDETTATASEIADAIGMSESTLRKRLARLKAREVLTTRRLSAFNSTSVWSVHLDRIPTDVSAGESRDDQSGHPGETDPVTSGVTNLGTSGVTKSATSSSKNRKNRSKNRGEALSVVEPSVGGSTTTPDERLEAAGLSSARDRGRFREWLRTAKNATSPNGVIMTRTPGDLASQVNEWRTSLDIETEGDAEPVLCAHGQDIAIGVHMCRECDPARQRPRQRPADVEPDGDGGVKMPEWVRQARQALETGDRSMVLALVAADETTPGGVTPSILEDAGIGAQNRA